MLLLVWLIFILVISFIVILNLKIFLSMINGFARFFIFPFLFFIPSSPPPPLLSLSFYFLFPSYYFLLPSFPPLLSLSFFFPFLPSLFSPFSPPLSFFFLLL